MQYRNKRDRTISIKEFMLICVELCNGLRPGKVKGIIKADNKN